MPVEIKELVIRAIVTETPDKKSEQKKELTSEEREAMISECVERVLKILKEAKER